MGFTGFFVAAALLPVVAFAADEPAAWPQGLQEVESTRSPDGHYAILAELAKDLPKGPAFEQQMDIARGLAIADLPGHRILGWTHGSYLIGEGFDQVQVVWGEDSKWCAILVKSAGTSVVSSEEGLVLAQFAGKKSRIESLAKLILIETGKTCQASVNYSIRRGPGKTLMIGAKGNDDSKAARDQSTRSVRFAGCYDPEKQGWRFKVARAEVILKGDSAPENEPPIYSDGARVKTAAARLERTLAGLALALDPEQREVLKSQQQEWGKQTEKDPAAEKIRTEKRNAELEQILWQAFELPQDRQPISGQ